MQVIIYLNMDSSLQRFFWNVFLRMNLNLHGLMTDYEKSEDVRFWTSNLH